jgi:trans-aconitate methyltransferase
MTLRHVDDVAATLQARLRTRGDPWNTLTLRRLDETGIGPGWRCLEIGVHVDEVAGWMLRRVGSSGTVVVIEIDTRCLDGTTNAGIEVRHHQTRDLPVDRGYDLIHARLVFEHLPQRTAMLAEMVAALRPGGFLVLEDYETRTMHRHGTDLTCEPQFPRLLRDAGLTEITAEGVLGTPILVSASGRRPNTP